MRALLRLAVLLTAAAAVATALGQLAARRRTWGDDDADDVSMATCFGGIDRSLRGPALRRARATAWFGGINLDLREATLAPSGAEMELEAIMGGIEATVSPAWRVEVELDAAAGGIDTRVTPTEELPSDAPFLRISAKARLGGILVMTDKDAAAHEDAPREPEPGAA